MKVQSLLINSICLILFTVGVQAQNYSKANIWKSHNTQLTVSNYFDNEQQVLGLAQPTDMQLVKTIEGATGTTHYKFQQQYKGIEVLNGIFILHEHNGNIKSANGLILPNIHLNISPALSVSSAEQIVESSILMNLLESNKISLSNHEDFVPAISNRKLCITDKSYPDFSGDYTLAWVFDFDHQSWPPQHDRYVVDAYDGEIISNIPLIHQENIETEVSTKFYGRRNITIDSVASDQYYLRDLTRGKGIFTVDGFDDELYESNDRDDWIKHDEEYETATDVHFCMEKYYDFLLEKFNWKSIDNDNFELRSIVHTRPDASYVNAYWNGREANFGDGNCNDYHPLTTLDVVGHEFTHGLTQHSSGLIYRGESGGLNESISDILGKMLEYEVVPNEFSWDLGPAFLKNPDARIFRSMSDPHKTNNPKYYKGINWFDEVHNTSGVLNFWFYLISDGEKATNEKGVDYDVVPIGKDKSTQIVFLMETGYLFPSSTYQDAVEASISATVELYGDNGPELIAVLEAWKAVGLSANVLADFDLKISIVDPLDGVENLCPVGNFNVSIKIENIGKNVLTKGVSIPLLLEQDGTKVSEETITLDNDLATGESVDYQFLESISIVGFSEFRTNIEASMSVMDDNSQNDKSLSVVNILRSNVAGSDLAMMSILSLRGGICISEDKELTNVAYLALVKNVGCDVIERGKEIEMDLSINGIIQKHRVNMPVDLLPGVSQFLTIEFDAEITAGDLELVIILDNEWDVRETNNEKSFTRYVSKSIDESYFQDFENFELATEQNIAFSGSNLAFSRVQLNGNEFLGFTTRRNVNVDRLEDCDKHKRFFNSNQKTGNISWCINLSEKLLSPNFEFDLVQFTSTQNAFPSDQKYQSMAVLSIPSDPTFEKLYYYGQNQGEVVHYKVPLKAGFSGNVQIEFFIAYGTANRLQNEEFDKIDAVLLDNVMISDEMVSTHQRTINNNITTHPNPANGIVNFKLNDNENIKSAGIKIYNLMGQPVHSNTITSDVNYKWKTNGLQSGIYLYEIINKGKRIGSGRIILEK